MHTAAIARPSRHTQAHKTSHGQAWNVNISVSVQIYARNFLRQTRRENLYSWPKLTYVVSVHGFVVRKMNEAISHRLAHIHELLCTMSSVNSIMCSGTFVFHPPDYILMWLADDCACVCVGESHPTSITLAGKFNASNYLWMGSTGILDIAKISGGTSVLCCAPTVVRIQYSESSSLCRFVSLCVAFSLFLALSRFFSLCLSFSLCIPQQYVTKERKCRGCLEEEPEGQCE